MQILNCPLPLFRHLLQDLLFQPDRVISIPIGVCQRTDGREWLARSPAAGEDKPSRPAGQFWWVRAASTPPDRSLIGPGDSAAGELALGFGPWRGGIKGWVNEDGQILPLDQLLLAGAGMRRIRLGSALQGGSHGDPALPPGDRWSRTIGALGSQAVWDRLVRLQFGVIGAGRTGSTLITSLVRLGVRHLRVMDPDSIELHNLGEMDGSLSEESVGTFKATAIADSMHSLFDESPPTILPLIDSVTNPLAWDKLLECDILCCCADNDAARLAAAVIAALYHRPLLDIGAGIFFPPPERDQDPGSGEDHRTMGADVRLVLPGDGCLLCRGGLTAYVEAVEALCRRDQPATIGAAARRPRAGSLNSLNMIAVGLGMTLLQDLVGDRVTHTTWAQVEVDPAGRTTIAYPDSPAANAGQCALCARAGMGDHGIRRGPAPASHPPKALGARLPIVLRPFG